MRGKVFSGLKARTDMWQWQTNRDKRIQRTGKFFFFNGHILVRTFRGISLPLGE